MKKEVHAFPKDIYPKVNVIAPLEFKLAMISQSSSLAITPQIHNVKEKRKKRE